MRETFIWQSGLYRITEIVDDHQDMAALKGDMFMPEHNPEITATELRKAELAFEFLVENDGVFGYELARWNDAVGAGWEHVDSCWGFVGRYSAENSHDIVDEFKTRAMELTKTENAVNTKQGASK